MPPLELTGEQFDGLAAQLLDVASEILRSLDQGRTIPSTSGAETAAAFDLSAPEKGVGAAVVADFETITAHARASTGRLFPYVVGSGEPVAALGDFLASILNQNVTAWRSAPSAVTVEKTVVGWLADAIGCSGFSGNLTSGGSLANLMALAMAREAHAPANDAGARPCLVYASEEVHMSIPKAVALLGIGRDHLRLIETDDAFRIRIDALEKAIVSDRSRGLQPVAIVASAGTITTGAIDPLSSLAELARENDLWLHVDGAYGAPAAMVEPALFKGLEHADSISLDAHKWLYQPLDCSLLLYRDPVIARTTFAYTGDYAKTLSEDPVEGFAYFEESVELSRRFRALKLWLSLRYHGLATFRAAIKENLRLARLLAQLVEQEPSLELLAPVELSAVCFRWTDDSGDTLDTRNAEILRRTAARGNVALSNARIRGRFGLRACIVNHRTTANDVQAIVREVLSAAQEG